MNAAIDLRYLVSKRDRHGIVRWYVRRGRRWKTIAGEPGSQAFLDAYRAARDALEGKAPSQGVKPTTAPAGSLRWLCGLYFASGEFRTGLGKVTQAKRRRLLERICQEEDGKVGDVPARLFKKRHIKALRDRHADTPEGANSMVKALRYLFAWAIEDEHLADNPADEVKLLKSRNPGGWHRWTIDEVEQFEKRHPIGTKPHLALSLFLYTGGRISDVARFGRQMAKGGRLRWTEYKNRERAPKEREIPILPVLQAAIDAAEAAGVTKGNLAYLITEKGLPFSVKGLGNKMRDWCDQATLPQCSAHGLRKAGATRAAENGASAHQLMAIFGWQTLKQAEVYTKEADSKRLAREAMHLIAAKEG